MIPAEHPRRKEAVRCMLGHCLDMSRGLEYIHNKGYTHRDMKLENVLIDNGGRAKITDVGVAKQTNVLVRTCNGSPAYMAPEVLLGTTNQTNKIDIYSLALILWEMWNGIEVASLMNKEILGKNPYEDALTELRKQMGDPRGGWRPKFRSPNPPPSSLRDVIEKSWSDDPEARPTSADLVKYFTDIVKNN